MGTWPVKMPLILKDSVKAPCPFSAGALSKTPLGWTTMLAKTPECPSILSKTKVIGIASVLTRVKAGQFQ